MPPISRFPASLSACCKERRMSFGILSCMLFLLKEADQESGIGVRRHLAVCRLPTVYRVVVEGDGDRGERSREYPCRFETDEIHRVRELGRLDGQAIHDH